MLLACVGASTTSSRPKGAKRRLRLASTGHSSWNPGDVPHPIIDHPGYLHVSRAHPRRVVRPPDGGQIWRELELTGGQTLGDLGEAIPLAFGFDDPHLWSFFLSGKPWDGATEHARSPSPSDDRPALAADRLHIRDALAGKEFLFLFDYGDEWHFGVRLVRTSTAPY
jgi:hypothetical protein